MSEIQKSYWVQYKQCHTLSRRFLIIYWLKCALESTSTHINRDYNNTKLRTIIVFSVGIMKTIHRIRIVYIARMYKSFLFMCYYNRFSLLLFLLVKQMVNIKTDQTLELSVFQSSVYCCFVWILLISWISTICWIDNFINAIDVIAYLLLFWFGLLHRWNPIEREKEKESEINTFEFFESIEMFTTWFFPPEMKYHLATSTCKMHFKRLILH